MKKCLAILNFCFTFVKVNRKGLEKHLFGKKTSLPDKMNDKR